MSDDPRIELMVGAHEVRLNALNGQIERNARATEKVGDKADVIEASVTEVRVELAEFKAETKGEHKSTRKELRLIGLAVAAATIISKFIPTPGQDAADAASALARLIGLG